MIETTFVELDNYKANNVADAIKHRERTLKKSFPANYGYLPLNDNYVNDAAGYDPQKLLDWRRLERRTNVVGQKLKYFEHRLSELMLRLYASAKKVGAQEIWVIGIEHSVYVIYESGQDVRYGIRELSTIVDDCKRYADIKGYIASEDDRHEFLRLIERVRTFHLRSRIMLRALKYSVEDRITSYVTENKEQIPNDVVFVLQNEGRQYRIEVKNCYGVATFNWTPIPKIFIAS